MKDMIARACSRQNDKEEQIRKTSVVGGFRIPVSFVLIAVKSERMSLCRFSKDMDCCCPAGYTFLSIGQNAKSHSLASNCRPFFPNYFFKMEKGNFDT